MKQFNNKLTIEINNVSNIPIRKGWNDFKNQVRYQNIDFNKYKCGLICNEKNNIICLDIDIKNGKNGLLAFNNYSNNFINEMIDYTLCEKTKSGGYHIYFTYKNSNKVIEDKLKIMKKKLNSLGYDFILNNNYVSCYPNKGYTLLNDLDIKEIPEDLFLYMFSCDLIRNNITDIKEIKCINYNDNNGEYSIYTDNELIEMLNKLDKEYLNNYSKWLIITTILKTEDKFDIWNIWCKNGNKYDYNNNVKIWNNINYKFNIDYINYITKTRPFNKYKTYKPITIDNIINKKDIDIIYLNKMKNKEEIFNYKNIIIKSCVGTGKTTIISEEVKKMIDKNNKLKFITITPRETLSIQHIKSFKDINIKNYKDVKADEPINILLNNNYTVCYNSIYKLFRNFTDNDISYMIIYLDEITSLLKYISHCDTVKDIKLIYNLFVRLIKNCYKLIMTDATINDLSFLLIDKYRVLEETIYINNQCKKQLDINVYKINNEYEFLDIIKEHINNNDYFLYASDSKTVITDHFNNHNIDNNKFRLFTQDSKHELNEEFFNNSFCYYSPSIQYGIDFNNVKAQDVFLYINGKSIESDDLMQMINRTRNIRNVYIFNNSKKQNYIKYHSLEECKDYFKSYVELDNNFNNMCLDFDNENNVVINENVFFDIYVYNEFVKSIYQLDKYKYLIEILKNNGMIINDNLEEKINLSKDDKEEYKNKSLEIQYNNFNKFLKNEIVNEQYSKRIEYLNLDFNNFEQMDKYKEYIIDNNKIENHNNIISLLKDDVYINNKVIETKHKKNNITSVDDIYHKINIFNCVVKKLNINKFILDYDNDKEFTLEENDFKLLIKQFKMRVKIPVKMYEFKKIHYKILNELCNNLCNKQRIKNNKVDHYIYFVNEDILTNELELNNIKNINKYDLEYDYIIDKKIINGINIELKKLINKVEIIRNPGTMYKINTFAI